MSPTPTTTPLSAEQTAVLAEFARACRTAARSVSLYPATHPSIRAALSRVTTAARRLVPAGDVTLTVHPDTLIVDGQTPARPDQAISELADLMHHRLVGALRVQQDADALDWHALLLLLARPADELIAEGGIGKAWVAAGRDHFEIREIDYAEVLRERAGGGATEWDQIIAFCLQGEVGALDSDALAGLLDMLGDSARFGDLIERLQTTAAAGDPTVSARAAAFLELVKRLLEASAQRSGEPGKESVLQTVADSTPRLTPEMLIEVIEHARAPERPQSDIASAVVERMGDNTIASFVASSVVTEGGASERLAEALQLLVPEVDRKERLLDAAKEEAEQTPLGQQSGFEDLWASAADMLKSYSDETYVSPDYARELSGAKTHAVDVERVSDDPPERIEEWRATVGAIEQQQLDLLLLLDLLKIEHDVVPWREVARMVVTEIERRTQLGEIQEAQQLVSALLKETGEGGREALRPAAESAIDTLVGGPLIRFIVGHLRKVDDANVEPFSRLGRTIGPRIIGPLADALVMEENSRAIRRLRELLFGFGAAGRETVERLKRSSNPAVRRTAIDMLRMFGGQDALADLATMLEDRDPLVQRDAIAAIAHLGNDEGFAVLQRALMAGTDSSHTIPQQLISLREERAVPLLCYVLNHSVPRGRLTEVHAQIIEALGALGAHPESTQTLRTVLYRGEWWAPARTKALRRAAALALRRVGSPEARAVLDEARQRGSRGVRTAARAQAGPAPREHERK